jgi:hypothetical protein
VAVFVALARVVGARADAVSCTGAIMVAAHSAMTGKSIESLSLRVMAFRQERA